MSVQTSNKITYYVQDFQQAVLWYADLFAAEPLYLDENLCVFLKNGFYVSLVDQRYKDYASKQFFKTRKDHKVLQRDQKNSSLIPESIELVLDTDEGTRILPVTVH